jgi:hypothetical protein
MSQRFAVPEELIHDPFSLVEARRAGVTNWQLRGSQWRRLGAGFYVHAKLALGPKVMLQACSRRLPAGAVFSGKTAAWLHGLDMRPDAPIEVTIPCESSVFHRAGMSVPRCALRESDRGERQGLPVTSRKRTAFDLARHLTLVEAVVALDMALHQRLVNIADIKTYVPPSLPRNNPGTAGG